MAGLDDATAAKATLPPRRRGTMFAGDPDEPWVDAHPDITSARRNDMTGDRSNDRVPEGEKKKHVPDNVHPHRQGPRLDPAEPRKPHVDPDEPLSDPDAK